MKSPIPRTRLISRMRKALDVHREVPDIEAALDVVLDEVMAMARPKLENDWTGGVVLHELERWRKRK